MGTVIIVKERKNIMFDKLVETRKRWNQLSDCIYEVGAGDLDNSRFSNIYQNFEDVVREFYISRYPKHTDFLYTNFSSIILDIAVSGFAAFVLNNGTYFTVSNEYDFEKLMRHTSFTHLEKETLDEERKWNVEAAIAQLEEHKKFFVDAWGGFENMCKEDKVRCDEIDNCIAVLYNTSQ